MKKKARARSGSGTRRPSENGWARGIAVLAGVAAIVGAVALVRARDRDGRALAASARFKRQFMADRFHKGNTHAHSAPRSEDADSSARDVLAWYRARGYRFVALTDHHESGRAGEFADAEVKGEFVVVPGEEVTFGVANGSEVHVGALCSSRSGGRHLYVEASRALLRSVEHVARQSGAVLQINHPNFKRALSKELILDAVKDGLPRKAPFLLEIANQHHQAVNAGEPLYGRLSTEELWDELLAAGKRVYGVASDDAHHLTSTRKDLGGSFDPLVPGLGWVQVEARGTELEVGDLCKALKDGRFYSSTGIELGSIRAQGDSLELRIVPKPGVSAENHVTYFIGAGPSGVRILDEQRGLNPRYVLKGGEKYVRARVCGPGEERKYPNRLVRMRETCAWVQPQWVSGS